MTFWGVRGSYPVPSSDTVRYGGHTSCVEVRSDSGACVVVDAGTGLRALGQKLADMAADTFAMQSLSEIASNLADRGGYDIRLEAAAAKEWNSVKGWDLIGAEMCVGDRWSATIPYQLAYGAQGHPAGIPPKQDLVFDLELLDIG